MGEDHLCELSLSISTKNIMSDTEQVMETEEVATETTPAAEPAVPEKMDVLTALKEVLKTALVNDALARGLHECAKVLDRRQAHFCALAANCTEPAYSSSWRPSAWSTTSTSSRSLTPSSLASGPVSARSTMRVTLARSSLARAWWSLPSPRSSRPPSRSCLSTSAPTRPKSPPHGPFGVCAVPLAARVCVWAFQYTRVP